MPRTGSCILLAMLPFVVVAHQNDQRTEPSRFRIAVDAVRIDVVVTDSSGQTVSDLTAADFDVRQDGRPQKVTFAEFVPVAARTERAAGGARPVSGAPSLPRGPTTREKIQRTIAVVIDDLGLSVESLYYTKKAVHAFIDNELSPSDLVAIVRTGGLTGTLQSFTTDPRVLHATTDLLRWNGFSRSGVEAFEPFNSWTTFDTRTGLADPSDFTNVDTLRSSMSAYGTLGALNLAIASVRDLPGRKALIFASEGFTLRDPNDSRLRRALDRAVDQATRAGVVIYSLDCRGLQTGVANAADNVKNGGGAGGRRETIRDTQEGLAYLAEQTGGFAVMNTNDLPRGLARIRNDLGDYYLIGYVPDAGTFARAGTKPANHRLSVRVRRRGVRVRTRKEFLGVADAAEAQVPLTPAQQLVRAAISPFTATDIALRATALPAFSPELGPFVRALLHVDASALTFTESEGGRKRASADVVGIAFNDEGLEVAHLSTGFAVALTDAAAADALRDGLAYTLRIRIPKPGAYQLRFAIRDQESGHLGSAGEFVEVANVPGGAFALSGFVLQSGENSGADSAGPTDAIAVPATEALRTYRPGAELTYAYEIYNAAGPVRVATDVWRGDEKVLAVPPAALVPPAGQERRFAAKGALKLGEALPPGTYVLQVRAVAADPGNRRRIRTALQRIDFDVR